MSAWLLCDVLRLKLTIWSCLFMCTRWDEPGDADSMAVDHTLPCNLQVRHLIMRMMDVFCPVDASYDTTVKKKPKKNLLTKALQCQADTSQRFYGEHNIHYTWLWEDSIEDVVFCIYLWADIVISYLEDCREGCMEHANEEKKKSVQGGRWCWKVTPCVWSPHIRCPIGRHAHTMLIFKSLGCLFKVSNWYLPLEEFP